MSSYHSKPQAVGDPPPTLLRSERQVVDKVTRHLMWFLFLLFVVSFLDRINIGFAGLTMMKDLGLTSTPKDATQSFATGLIYAALLLVVGCAIMLILPMSRTARRAA